MCTQPVEYRINERNLHSLDWRRSTPYILEESTRYIREFEEELRKMGMILNPSRSYEKEWDIAGNNFEEPIAFDIAAFLKGLNPVVPNYDELESAVEKIQQYLTRCSLENRNGSYPLRLRQTKKGKRVVLEFNATAYGWSKKEDEEYGEILMDPANQIRIEEIKVLRIFSEKDGYDAYMNVYQDVQLDFIQYKEQIEEELTYQITCLLENYQGVLKHLKYTIGRQ